jgi:hypothetical protein
MSALSFNRNSQINQLELRAEYRTSQMELGVPGLGKLFGQGKGRAVLVNTSCQGPFIGKER